MIAKIIVPIVLAAGVVGCASTDEPTAPTRPSAARPLAANLVSPTDIKLEWQNVDQGAAGHVVEYASERGGPYTILQFAPPGQTTYAHEQLMPQTPFYYRLRPYYGPAAAPIEVTLPQGPTSEGTEASTEWADPKTVAVGQPATTSIRSGGDAGTPTELKATVMGVEGIKFTWVDHATDEEAYLIEMKLPGSPDYSVLMTLDPNVNSVGVVTLPDEKVAQFRVRPIYYGKASNIATRTTGGTAD